MTSHQPAQCCTIGVKHEGTPIGEVKSIGETSTYFVSPNSPKPNAPTILILTDVIGHLFVNAQLVADQFAANGYHVCMPDLFHGDPIPLNRPKDFDLMAWLKGPPGHMPDRVEPVVKEAISYLKNEKKAAKLGAVGYCFGAKYAIRSLAEGGGVDVGYVAHPSFVEAEELKSIKGPLSIAAAETDEIFPAPKRHESEEILASMDVPYQINLYSGCQHGFGVRADVSSPQAKFAKEQAFLQAVTWFDEHLK